MAIHSERLACTICLSIILLFLFPCDAFPGGDIEDKQRTGINLAGEGWKVWLDREAGWKEDELYLSGDFELYSLPVNPPSCGWEGLDAKGTDCTIPASLEEIFSEGINSWRYHGVSWFWKRVVIPEEWRGKVIRLDVGKARLRVEVYINHELALYDLVAETPLQADISEFVDYGNSNLIAFRLTNPGGNRGWQDFPGISWGSYKLPASHDFTGIDIPLSLTALNPLHIRDVFVKNLLPVSGKRIKVIASLNVPFGVPDPQQYRIEILSDSTGETLFSDIWDAELLPGNKLSKIISVPDAELWDLESPELYVCRFSVLSGSGLEDTHGVRFGFRTFEALEVNGRHNFYLNGKRVRFRSAIDWGYYALTGFYPTHDMARKSVEAARAIGHNALNFHRRIGEPLVMDYADELGLYLYEEPGGFHAGFQTYTIRPNTFTAAIMKEKCRRMVLRDRNHPSLMIYNLCNEDFFWNELREEVMRMIHGLDGSRLVCNSSGWLNMNHMRPYEDSIRLDYIDDHTVESKARFEETEFKAHETYNDSNLIYWGEVRCYTGPPNWYECAGIQKNLSGGTPGYDMNIYKPLHDKIVSYFDHFNFPETGSRNIRSYADLSRQAGRGLMYTDGRLGQVIMSHNSEDGYAINGWSGGPQLPDEWESAIVDEGRNLKGPATDYSYWIREKQIAIFRQNGKYFNVSDTALFDLHLINEGRIPAGSYLLRTRITDGNGEHVADLTEKQIQVEGGDVYAQKLVDNTTVVMKEPWHAGHISVVAELLKDGKVIADGTEQVLLRNRKSWYEDLEGYSAALINWLPAEIAILETGNSIREYSDSISGKLDYALIGYLYKDHNNDKVYKAVNMAHVEDLFRRVHDDGTVLFLRFDEHWADYLFEMGILSVIPDVWRGWQTGGWKGNGWGYLDHFVGDQAVPSGSTISTNSWEVPMDAMGFYPFRSPYPHAAYGTFFASPGDLVTTLGTISYGKGTIIIDPSYWVDYNETFNDILFYRLITKNIAELNE